MPQFLYPWKNKNESNKEIEENGSYSWGLICSETTRHYSAVQCHVFFNIS
jgi:hypothetical protein